MKEADLPRGRLETSRGPTGNRQGTREESPLCTNAQESQSYANDSGRTIASEHRAVVACFSSAVINQDPK